MFNIMSIVKEDYKDLISELSKLKKEITGISMVAMEKNIELEINENVLDYGFDD